MPKIVYKSFNFRSSTLEIIDNANIIINDYLAQGFDLTLRQLYYQFVSRDLFPDSWADPNTGSKNNEKSYGKLGSIINDARLAGMIDWNAISDRTRHLRELGHWTTPASVIRSAEASYRLDKWQGQEFRPEVWIEKDALIGVIGGICNNLDIPYFSCRGYVSQSEMWATAQRFISYKEQTPYLIHLGDHDPSGIDMTRDIIDRLEMFIEGDEGYDFHVKRIALNHSQVLQYNPPPNPTKLTDSRASSYLENFGDECWELDALEPAVIVDLIQDEVFSFRDVDILSEVQQQEDREKEELKQIRTKYNDIVDFLQKT